MKRVALIGLIAASALRCLSGSLPDDPLTFPVLIVHAKGTGSGCILQLSNSVYLLTAKHVLFAEPDGTNAPALLSPNAAVRAYSAAGSTNVSERNVQLNLAQLLATGEVRFSTNRDVALVRIEECIPTNRSLVVLLPGVTFSTPTRGLSVRPPDVLCCLTNVGVGADVFMFGYPTSLTAPMRGMFDPTQPLLRKGIVAGINLSRRTIVVDCPAYQGNSGGPVLQVEHPALNVTSFKIIGLVSAFVPFQEEWENKTLRYSHVILSNSGYTLIEPIAVALELVWK